MAGFSCVTLQKLGCYVRRDASQDSKTTVHFDNARRRSDSRWSLQDISRKFTTTLSKMQGDSLRALFDSLGPGGGSEVMPAPREDLGGDMLVPALAKHEGRRLGPKPFLPEKLWFFKIQRLERRLKQALKTGPVIRLTRKNFHLCCTPTFRSFLTQSILRVQRNCPCTEPNAEGSTC